MSLIAELVGEAIAHLLIEGFLHATGRRVLFVISIGRIRIPPLDSRDSRWVGDIAAFVAGALFWLIVVVGAAFAAYSALT